MESRTEVSSERVLEYWVQSNKLIVDNTVMDKVREKRRNFVVAFYNYEKAYDMVRYD